MKRYCPWCECEHEADAPHIPKTRWMIWTGEYVLIYPTRKKAMAQSRNRTDGRKPVEVEVTPTKGWLQP
jgi:hypothetical protein